MIKNYLNNILYYPRYFYTYLRTRLFVLIIICLLIGVLDGFGLAMFMPMLQMADGSGQIDPESLGKMKFLVDIVARFGFELNFNLILFLLCLFFVLKGAVVYLGNVYKVSVQQFFVKSIRLEMLDALTFIKFKKFITADVGTIQNTMSGEVARLSMSLTYYLGVIQNFVMTLVYVAFAVIISPKFSVLVIIGGLLINLSFRSIYSLTKKYSVKLTEESNLYQGLLIQFVANFKYLRATGTVSILEKRLRKQIEHLEKNNKQMGILASLVSAIREPSMILVVSGAIIFETKVMGTNLSTILVSLLFFYRALSSLMAVQTNWNGFLGMSGSMENMKLFQKNIGGFRENYGSKNIGRFSESLVLENVSLKYDSKQVLYDIQLTVNHKESIAFIGESGSGKTSLLNVLSGLVPVESGSFRIDGVDVNKIDMRSFQKNIGYITQEPVIFNGTIYENISFWAPKTEENLLRFKDCLKLTSLTKFIKDLDEGENTLLGNNGINLSGGQRQRISIARELFKDVRILIMDEATSALDSETEKSIKESITMLRGKYTIIMVAHRLSTIKDTDRIYIMENGRICEEGNYEELIQHSSKFRKMIQLQEL